MISEGNPLQLADVENAHWQVDLEAESFSLYLFLSLVRAILKLIAFRISIALAFRFSIALASYRLTTMTLY